jgi:hypothetical protein
MARVGVCGLQGPPVAPSNAASTPTPRPHLAESGENGRGNKDALEPYPVRRLNGVRVAKLEGSLARSMTKRHNHNISHGRTSSQF